MLLNLWKNRNDVKTIAYYIPVTNININIKIIVLFILIQRVIWAGVFRNVNSANVGR